MSEGADPPLTNDQIVALSAKFGEWAEGQDLTPEQAAQLAAALAGLLGAFAGHDSPSDLQHQLARWFRISWRAKQSTSETEEGWE